MAIVQLQLLAVYLCLLFYSGKRFDFVFKAFNVFDRLNISRKLVPEFELIVGEASLLLYADACMTRGYCMYIACRYSGAYQTVKSAPVSII